MDGSLYHFWAKYYGEVMFIRSAMIVYYSPHKNIIFFGENAGKALCTVNIGIDLKKSKDCFK